MDKETRVSPIVNWEQQIGADELLDILLEKYGSLNAIKRKFSRTLRVLNRIDKKEMEEEKRREEIRQRRVEKDLKWLDENKPKGITVAFKPEPTGDVLKVDHEKRCVYLSNYDRPFYLNDRREFRMDHDHRFFVHRLCGQTWAERCYANCDHPQ
jgi:hypothetical protein